MRQWQKVIAVRNMQFNLNKLMLAFQLFIVIVGSLTNVDPIILIVVATSPLYAWGEILKNQVREDIMNED